MNGRAFLEGFPALQFRSLNEQDLFHINVTFTANILLSVHGGMDIHTETILIIKKYEVSTQ